MHCLKQIQYQTDGKSAVFAWLSLGPKIDKIIAHYQNYQRFLVFISLMYFLCALFSLWMCVPKESKAALLLGFLILKVLFPFLSISKEYLDFCVLHPEIFQFNWNTIILFQKSLKLLPKYNRASCNINVVTLQPRSQWRLLWFF